MPGPLEIDEVRPPDGILLVDKPDGITSHGVVARARRAYGTRKVGHAGTLDPMATGLLLLGLGPSTRLLTYLVGLDKVYTATIRLGSATTTDDREGEPLGAAVDARPIAESAIRDAMAALTGSIEQVPSSVSAIKVDGRRSYARVRAGEDVELAARPVTVSEFSLLGRSAPEAPAGVVDLEVRVACSSGTYVRALARDLGRALGVGGHLTALRRVSVGPFLVTEAPPLDDLGPGVPLLPPADAAARVLPSVEVDAGAAVDLGHGKRIAVAAPDGGPLAVVNGGRLVALVRVTDGTARVLSAFPTATQPEAAR
jgi:tRNA pseudouridine55 synthase